jgi:transcription termination/antitermination protein NusA
MDIKEFKSAIGQIAEEKGLSAEKIIESIESALSAAYKKDYGERGQIINAKLDQESGGVSFSRAQLVVDENMIYSEEELESMQDHETFEETEESEKVRFNSERHIMLEEAQDINSEIQAGEELITPLESKKDYGRIAAQTAKQVIMQRIREAEKETVFDEYKDKEGELVSGVVQRVEGRLIFIDLGKTIGVLPKEEQVRGEFYRPGQRLRLYVLSAEKKTKGPSIVLSRAYPKIVSKLFELEVPEINAEQLAVRSIAREAGSRSKVAVEAIDENIDPIGAMIGQRGTRVMAVINELGGEKVDIIPYSEDTEEYISNAIAPAKVSQVKILPKNTALIIVPEDQLSLAIGKEGQNVRLAAKLTGWKIDVRSEKNPDEPTVADTNDSEKKEEEPEVEEKVKVEKKPKKVTKKKITKKKETKK